MATEIDGTKAPHHGLFYMENAGGYNVEPQEPASGEHQSSCFALEEEKGEGAASNFAVLKVWQATNRSF